MKSSAAGATLVLVTSLYSAAVLSQSPASLFSGPVSVQGKAFQDARGQRFIVRGVALASNTQGKDFLADTNYDYMSTQILPRLQDLNVNTIRVYSVDAGANHDRVMALLQDAGIYVMVGMATSQININRVNPTYTPELRNRVFNVIDAFSKYPNTLAFSVGGTEL
ncbi:hypothetical protein [Candidatus Thiodictyon syntrophicum]|jgi:hypothetical protein|uniref:Glycoside hydrolase family 2 catalytic domain-containing protein n=1 Tax=Candidatus Thiodictyon syntrophicum TaxID=1166950 RepID=A0A2K8UIM0_9GAMM|nr:hypothetical protein [Candidatus Thiodictyon syntrophicum]AUB85398.1 hypothetical protein THSYN_31230 [Candidatus Thiodictyon syntrophicum]